MSRVPQTFPAQPQAITDLDYRASFKDGTCSIIGCNRDGVVLHHSRLGIYGMTVKHDPHGYPLCSAHHTGAGGILGVHGYPGGEASFIALDIWLPMCERAYLEREK